ncbi:zinc-finger domain-containing protein [Paenibacillus shunpengii]|uniref:Zinc-finger domain-containing protein n=1 Tax=Paenibacillus shunpengii TaxID=2054424 RepID=A0ABW5SX01_9BACL
MTSRIEVVQKIDGLLDNECKKYDRRKETTFCSTQCDVGIQLAELGKELLQTSRPRKKTSIREDKPMGRMKFTLTEEEYKAERDSGKSLAVNRLRKLLESIKFLKRLYTITLINGLETK